MDQQKSDEDIIVEERRRFRAWKGVTTAAALVLVAACTFGVLSIRWALPEQFSVATGLPPDLVLYIPLILVFAILIALVLFKLRFAPSRDSLRPSVQRKMVNDYVRRQRQSLIGLMLLVVVLALNRGAFRPGIADGFSGRSILFLFSLLLASLTIVFGPGFLNARFRAANEDELSRVQRLRATQIGYVCAMVALGGCYVVNGLAPDMLAETFPLALAACFVFPAAYLLWADLRSGGPQDG